MKVNYVSFFSKEQVCNLKDIKVGGVFYNARDNYIGMKTDCYTPYDTVCSIVNLENGNQWKEEETLPVFPINAEIRKQE